MASLFAAPLQQARADGALGGAKLRLNALPTLSSTSMGRPSVAGDGNYLGGHGTTKGHKPKGWEDEVSFAGPLAVAYILAPAMLAAGFYYSEQLGFDDTSRSTQIAFGAAPFLLPSIIHLGYDDPVGALVALGGMVYFASLGAVTGGIAGYMWEVRDEVHPSAWSSGSARTGALIGAGVGYALWALIDVVALSKVPARDQPKPQAKRGVAASITPVMGPPELAPNSVAGASMSLQGAW